MLFDLNPKSITPKKNISGKETTPDENTKIVEHKLISKGTNENRTPIAKLTISKYSKNNQPTSISNNDIQI